MAWEIVFMLVILKIPIVYLCVVIWWAIKAEPTPPDLAEVTVVVRYPAAGGAPHGRRAGGVRGRPRRMPRPPRRLRRPRNEIGVRA